jgi:hypothetical protein
MRPGGGKERKAPMLVYEASKKIMKGRNGNKMTFGRPKKTMRMENRKEEGRKIVGWECNRRPFNPHEKAREMARKF